MVGNAVKFTQHGHISIKMTMLESKSQLMQDNSLPSKDSKDFEQQKLYIEVEDSGSGIEEQELKKLIRLIYSKEIDANIQNMGLGLNICSKILQSMKGKMQIESKVGAGTRLKIFLEVGVKK